MQELAQTPDVPTMIRIIVKIILSKNVVALNSPYNTGIASIVAVTAKTAIAFILPII